MQLATGGEEIFEIVVDLFADLVAEALEYLALLAALHGQRILAQRAQAFRVGVATLQVARDRIVAPLDYPLLEDRVDARRLLLLLLLARKRRRRR